MKISKKDWHYRLYAFTRRRLDVFWNKPPHYRFDDERGLHVNLCPYMRTLLIYGPLLLLVYITLGFGIFTDLLWLPARWVPYLPLGSIFYTIVLIIVCAIAAAAALALGVGVVYVGSKGVVTAYNACMEKKEKEHTGFCHLVAEYWKSFHDGICPQIDVE